jgi:N-acetylmuramate 1-kinase
VIDTVKDPVDARLTALKTWLSGIEGVARAEPVPASVDASFRRYFRVHKGPKSFIAMDAPPEREDCRPFIRVAGYLESMKLNAPRVIEADLDAGFLLLTDLGAVSYLDQLRHNPDRAGALYGDALQALNRMQSRGAAFQSHLPPYDDALLRFELSLFHDWLCGEHLGIRFAAGDENRWQAACDLLVANALDQPQVFVHRDYHSRNLMVTARDNPGILDFQDAVEGPLTYDLVSLVKDCYVNWPPGQVDQWIRRYHADSDVAAGSGVAFEPFRRHFELMGVQRHLKASGIFARLNHRDGKPGYLADVPRTLRYIVEVGPRYPELAFLASLIADRCLPAFEASA